MTAVPPHLRRFLPETPEPTPAEHLAAYLAEHEPRPRRAPALPITGWRRAVALGAALWPVVAVVGRLGWRVVG